MMKAVIFLNGDKPSKDLIKKITASLIICADGAYEYLKDIITPTVVLGDFDSGNKPVNDNFEVIEYPVEKDYTDGHLCLSLAIERGATTVEIYGAFGGRVDHFYANLSLLYQAKKRGVECSLCDEKQSVFLKDGKFTIKTEKNKTISIEPFFKTAHIIKTEGLKWQMEGVTLNREHILGISNVATSDEVIVETSDEVLVTVEK